MKKSLLIFAAILMMAGFSTKLSAQVTIESPEAGAVLVRTLTIAQVTPLNFGTIGVGADAGSVTMNTTGVRTLGTGATTFLVNTGVQRSVAQFDMTGTASAAYSFLLPTVDGITVSSGANTMNISDLVVSIGGTGDDTPASPTTQGTLSLLGAQSIFVAGKLNIGANQPIGEYSGTYTIVIDYVND